ncbi:MAG: hypothetical protein IIY21_04600 [Clostridiales bacterium]|nr:hypothetical protein [Clostridiales bacterium]MBQ1573833.1 hypothetical protein [Clostridiales bacterium]
MKAVTEIPTKNTKWCIYNQRTHEIVYASVDKTMATALVVGQAFVSKVNATYEGPHTFRGTVLLHEWKNREIGEIVAVCYGTIQYNGQIYGKMIDGRTNKRYLADIVIGQRINKNWGAVNLPSKLGNKMF